MGNSLGGRKSAKVMKINGETIKVKIPVRAGSVLEGCPGHVLLESEAVKHYGVRAKPLEPQQELKPRRLYFLVELPKVAEEENKIGARRVRSGIQMSAKDRLESLMLARRSASDLSSMKPTPMSPSSAAVEEGRENGGGGVRVRMRLPKAEVERLMAESRDGAEVAEKIARLCMDNGGGGGAAAAAPANGGGNGGDAVVKRATKSREKRVGFLPISDTEIHHLTVAS